MSISICPLAVASGFDPPPHPARTATARTAAGQRFTVVQRRRPRKGYRPAVVKLFVLDELYAVVRCDPDAPVPDWANGGHFWSVTRSDSELSIVCREDDVPADASAERGWCALELAGPLDFSLTGVVSALVVPLADAEVPIFVLSTFETDYLLVREHDLQRSVEALTRAGHEVDS
jgi:hypothetical protein